LSSLASTAGCASVTAAGGTLMVAAGATITATAGDLILQNMDAVGGIIEVGNGAVLTANSSTSTGGRIVLVSGVLPVQPQAGTAPSSNWAVKNAAGNPSGPTAGGQIFYGPNGLTTLSSTNTAVVDGGVL